MVVGGTGQYIWALYEGWNVPKVPPDPEFRHALELEAEKLGRDALYQRLKVADPQRASELDPRNVRRVIRALEVHYFTGLAPSNFGKLTEGAWPGPVIGLTLDRDRLYERIDQRVERDGATVSSRRRNNFRPWDIPWVGGRWPAPVIASWANTLKKTFPWKMQSSAPSFRPIDLRAASTPGSSRWTLVLPG